ncbi:hypothetical protein [Streptomyces nojiriensis]
MRPAPSPIYNDSSHGLVLQVPEVKTVHPAEAGNLDFGHTRY